jgi:hypothetical protein
MSDTPGLSKIVPKSVNKLPSTSVDGTEITTDVNARPVTVIAPVRRTLRSAMRVLRSGR